MPTWFFLTALGVFGLVFGSFGNVVIWRLPRGESLSHPASHCPGCDTPIAWHDNIPVASWLLLRGRCRACGNPISARYPAVETLSAILWVTSGLIWGQSLATAFGVALFYLLLLLSFIDLDTMRLPNKLVGLLAAIGGAGVAVSVATSSPVVPLLGVPASGSRITPLVFAAGGLLLSSGTTLGIALLYRLWRKREGFGMGDVKLLAAIGLFLGFYGVFALFIGSILGAMYGIVATSAKRLSLRSKFPFGPFLAVGAVMTCAFGPQLLHWYLALSGLTSG